MRIQDPTPSSSRPLHFSRIGKVKAGEKKVTAQQQEYPAAADHFILQSDVASLQALLTERYGSHTTELPIRFYANDESQSCDERYELRTHKGELFAYGDGLHFWVYDAKVGTYQFKDVGQRPTAMNELVTFLQQGLDLRQQKAIQWRRVLVLRFMLPDLPMLGYFELRTQGKQTSIPNLRNSYDQAKQLFGSVVGLPFTLLIRKVKSSGPGEKKHYPVLDLLLAVSPKEGFEQGEQLLVRWQAALNGQSALPAPVPEVQEAIVADEGPRSVLEKYKTPRLDPVRQDKILAGPGINVG